MVVEFFYDRPGEPMKAADLLRIYKSGSRLASPNPVAIRLEDLYGIGRKRAADFTVRPVSELDVKLAQLSPQDREYVMRELAAGRPVKVKRPLQPGEVDNGDREQLYMLVQGPPPNPANMPAQSQSFVDARFKVNQEAESAPAAPDNGDTTPWASDLASARRRAGIQPMPFMPGQHGAVAYREAATRAMQAAFAARAGRGAPSAPPSVIANDIVPASSVIQGGIPTGNAREAAMRHMARDITEGTAFFSRNGRF